MTTAMILTNVYQLIDIANTYLGVMNTWISTSKHQNYIKINNMGFNNIN